MRSMATDCLPVVVGIAVAFLGCGLLATSAPANDVAPETEQPPTVSRELAPVRGAPVPAAHAAAEVAALETLAARLAARRTALDARRHELAREHHRLSAVDRPAGATELALWLDTNATGDRLERDMAALRALIGALTPEGLRTVSLSEASTGLSLAPDAGLSRTGIEVNLRAAPEDPLGTLRRDPQDNQRRASR